MYVDNMFAIVVTPYAPGNRLVVLHSLANIRTSLPSKGLRGPLDLKMAWLDGWDAIWTCT